MAYIGEIACDISELQHDLASRDFLKSAINCITTTIMPLTTGKLTHTHIHLKPQRSKENEWAWLYRQVFRCVFPICTNVYLWWWVFVFQCFTHSTTIASICLSVLCCLLLEGRNRASNLTTTPQYFYVAQPRRSPTIHKMYLRKIIVCIQFVLCALASHPHNTTYFV